MRSATTREGLPLSFFLPWGKFSIDYQDNGPNSATPCTRIEGGLAPLQPSANGDVVPDEANLRVELPSELNVRSTDFTTAHRSIERKVWIYRKSREVKSARTNFNQFCRDCFKQSSPYSLLFKFWSNIYRIEFGAVEYRWLASWSPGCESNDPKAFNGRNAVDCVRLRKRPDMACGLLLGRQRCEEFR